jgi:hypothetical protein
MIQIFKGERRMNIPTEISFYDEILGKEIRGSYVVERNTITVTSADGVKSTRIGAMVTRESQAGLARTLLRDLAWRAIEDQDLK